LGQRIVDLALVPRTSRLLAVDEHAHELLVLEADGQQLNIVQRLAVSPYPVSIQVSTDGSLITIASLWSRRLTFIEPGSTAKVTHVLDFPFAPRMQSYLPAANRLLVADAFGGRLALVDPQKREITGIREFPGHNIRGLGVSPSDEMLLVAHQMLNDLAHSIRNDIHWGLLMSNDLRWLKVDSVLSGGEHLYRGGHMHPLGDAGRGGGE